MEKQVNNSLYATTIEIGASKPKQILWYFVNAFIFQTPYFPVNALKISLLRLFGAKIGTNTLIKPSVNIKYPWKLHIGNHTWIGEKAWIDNLADVIIGNNVCISQGAMLLTGNHNYSKTTFDLIIGKIILEDGVWIGAQATVCPAITCASHAVLAVNSVATKNLDAYTIYQGNPAQAVKQRSIT
jgi:putative colanic acid biosynthesis acetyltransferase WcaF